MIDRGGRTIRCRLLTRREENGRSKNAADIHCDSGSDDGSRYESRMNNAHKAICRAANPVANSAIRSDRLANQQSNRR